jgi:YVTN family beta-propeller protein
MKLCICELLVTVGFALAGILGSAQAFAQNAYIPNAGSNTVSVIHTATNTVIGSPIAVGSVPKDVAVTPDGSKVYVANNGTDTVSVIDTATHTVVATIRVGPNPYGVAVTPDGRKVYVTNCGCNTPMSALFPRNTVSVIDTATDTVIGSPIAVGSIPLAVAASPDGSKVYVTNSASNTVSAIATAANTVTAFPVSEPRGLAVSPDGSEVYAANNRSDTVSVIDTSTNTVTYATPVGFNRRGETVSPDGRNVYITNNAHNIHTVSMIDTATNTVIGSPILVGFDAFRVAVSPDGSKVYVTNASSSANRLPMTGTATNTMTATIPAGVNPAALGISIQPFQPPPRFAGTPGKANCQSESAAGLAQQFGGLNTATAAWGFPSIRALQDAILAFCKS